MKKAIITLTIVLCMVYMAGCNKDSNINLSKDENFSDILAQIVVPDMSISILSANESTQLAWLEDIYTFEDNTLRSKVSNLTEDDLQLVEAHLSRVYGMELTQLLLDGFYQFDEASQTYYVPDGEWFTYNERWTSSQITIIEQTDQEVILTLQGIDDYYMQQQNIQHYFSIKDKKLVLEKRVYN